MRQQFRVGIAELAVRGLFPVVLLHALRRQPVIVDCDGPLLSTA